MDCGGGGACSIVASTLTLTPTENSARIKAADDVEAIAYSEEAIAKALANGSIVFVDFTADWCITCKVNERIAIDVASTQTLFEREGVVFMVADWTLEDEAITSALARFGRVGVPSIWFIGQIYPNRWCYRSC